MENSANTKKRFAKNILYVLFSNGCTVLSGILIGFMIPKMLGVEDYGYYKTFTLYCSYIGVLHFGFIDGIYLFYAGKKYDELSKKSFRTYTRFLFLSQIILSVILLIVSFFIFSENKLIILFVVLNIFPVIMTSYYEFITQITMRFKLTSLRSIIRNTFMILSILVMYLLNKYNVTIITYYIYIIVFLSINYIQLFWYVFTYRDITFGKGTSFKEEKSNIISFIKTGIPLLLANLVAQLIFVVDQQFVNLFFINETYSAYAFAYSMINLVTVATGAISVVLYPTLKKIDINRVKDMYGDINSYILMLLAFFIIAYFPLVLIVTFFLEEYVESLVTLRIILPGVMISSCISVIKYNCYKKTNDIKLYFIISVIALIIAIIADLIVVNVYGNTASISIVSIIVLLIWYLLVELVFVKKYNVKWKKNFFYMLMIILAFYLSTMIENIYISFLVYVLTFIIITLISFKKLIQQKIKSKSQV